MAEENPSHNDDDMMLDQVARECMDAIEKKDKDTFMECFHVLISDIMQKMSSTTNYEE